MRSLHLFAGAGGGLLADLILGHQPVCAVEIEPYCCDVLRQRAGFDPADWKGRVDILHAGFPCQDLSFAGKGAGIHGKRSGLYREVIRCVEVLRPEWVFLENVPAIRQRGRHVVIGDLVALGYTWRDGSLAAADVGSRVGEAIHIRNRWWCLAHRTDATGERCGEAWPDRSHQLAQWTAWLAANLPDANGVGPQVRSDQSGGVESAVGSLRDWWAREPGVGRVADGISDQSHRIKAIGNAQCPLAAAAAWVLLGGPVT